MDLYKEWRVNNDPSKEMIARRYMERFCRVCREYHKSKM